MKTIAMTALLLGTIAVGIAPAAEARERHHRGDCYERHDHDRYGHDRYERAEHVRRVKAIRGLAFQLERATDELHEDARRAAGRRVNRGDARALRAIAELERATDRLARETRGRHGFAPRELRRELVHVERELREARVRSRALRPSRELHRDFGRVTRLVAAIGREIPGHRFVAETPWGFRVAVY